jgi:hypothetical protein
MMSEKFSGKGNPMYGRCGSEAPSYGRVWSEEMKRRISESNKGKHYDTPSCKKV